MPWLVFCFSPYIDRTVFDDIEPASQKLNGSARWESGFNSDGDSQRLPLSLLAFRVFVGSSLNITVLLAGQVNGFSHLGGYYVVRTKLERKK